MVGIKTFLLAGVLCIIGARSVSAQKGYEFEVYNTRIAPRGGGNLELHTNFVAASSSESDPASAPLRRAFRSALELSTGSLRGWTEVSISLAMRDPAAVCSTSATAPD